MRRTLATIAAALAPACARGSPPAPDVSPSVAMPDLGPLPQSAGETPIASSPTASSPIAPAPVTSTAPVASTPRSTPDTDLLPQTHEQPHASGPAFDARVAGLWSAIAADDPAKAMPFFFPLGAYEQVKDISDPAADWRRRLVAAYHRDINVLHARLADSLGRARFVALDVPEARARWVDPGEEYNKVGYFRVFGSKLRYQVDGQERTLDVKSLISWRGQWYVVHLSAIK